MKFPWSFGILALISLKLVTACRPTLRDPVSSSKTAEETQALEGAWNDYFVTNFAKHYPYELQEACKPVFARASAEVPFRGTAIFFHGYTACSQQFYEMRDNLTARGFHVLIPTLPGQGRAPSPTSGDTPESRAHYYEFLPRVETDGATVYRNFVNDMNAIMRKAPGEHMIGGLSVGGALAFGAVMQAPGLYQRALLLAPFFTVPPDNFWRPVEPEKDGVKARWGAFYANAKLKIEGDIRRAVITHKTDWVPKEKQELRWGNGCYKQNANGRAGICDTTLFNLAAVVNYGDTIKELANAKSNTPNSVPPQTQIQIATVEFDDGSDTRATKNIFKTVRDNLKFKMDLCFYRGVPHSFLSRYDHPDMAMEWLPHFYDRANKFFVDGEFFDTNGVSDELIRDPGLVSQAVSVAFPKKDGSEKPEDYFPLCRK